MGEVNTTVTDFDWFKWLNYSHRRNQYLAPKTMAISTTLTLVQCSTNKVNKLIKKGQCTRTITLFKVFKELLPFVTFQLLFFWPEHKLKNNGWNAIQFHQMIKHIERKCSAEEPYRHLDRLQSYCPLFLFLVRRITWKILVKIQYNFIKCSSTLKGSTVHKNHNFI
jgi:hypothetical protein